MPCPSHPPWLHHSNYTLRRVQVMKLLIFHSSSSSVFLTRLSGPDSRTTTSEIWYRRESNPRPLYL
jgi:hypothetical protein